MPQMMMNIFQYVPYVLLVAAVFLLLGGGVIYTFRFFKHAEVKSGRAEISLK